MSDRVDFVHKELVGLPSYDKVRQALSDLANESAGVGTFGEFVSAVADMARTSCYGDGCRECRRSTGSVRLVFPHEGVASGETGIRCNYECPDCWMEWSTFYRRRNPS